MNVAAIVNRLTAPLKRRVRLMVMRGLVELVKEDTKMQAIQFSGHTDFLRDDAERFQQYGFSSHPLVGAEAIAVMVGGNTDHPVVIVVDDRRHRPKTLEEGEACMYTNEAGVRILIKPNGDIEIGTDPEEYAARADRVDAELEALQNKFNGHTHMSKDTFSGMGSITNMATEGPSTGDYTPESTACDEVKIK
jgi:phage baseplate assembly protein V